MPSEEGGGNAWRIAQHIKSVLLNISGMKKIHEDPNADIKQQLPG